MSISPRTITTNPQRRAVIAPTRPIKPYISLDDVNAQEFFTKPHVFNHLRRAGLLNKNGEILTQAEYDIKNTDVSIGRENRRKVDDAIVDVLCDLAREHWAYTRDYTEQMRVELIHQFRRMENEYSQRSQPITIRHRADGRVEIETDETTSGEPSDASQDPNKSSTGILPRVIRFQPIPRPRSAQRTDNLYDIREGLDKMRSKLTTLEGKVNKDSKNNENRTGLTRIELMLNNIRKEQTNMQEQQKQLTEKVDKEKQRIDRLITQTTINRTDTRTKPAAPDESNQLSPLAQSLQGRILNLETSFLHLSKGLAQDIVDQELDTNGKDVSDRGYAITNVARTTGNKLKTMQTELTQLSSRVNQSPSSITYADAHKLIENETETYFQTHKKDLEGKVTDKINDLENQLNAYLQSNQVSDSSNLLEPIDRSLLIQKPIKQTNKNIQQLLNDIERRLNNIPPPQDLTRIEQRLVQLEIQIRSINDPRVPALQDQIKKTSEHVQTLQVKMTELDKNKLGQQDFQQTLDYIDQKIKQVQNFHNEMKNALANKFDSRTVDQIAQNNEKITQQMNTLQQFLEENRETLKTMEKRLNQQSS